MKILKFRLNNFRSFYKETQWFSLSGDDKKNVTVIHCENGVGKTTILNALIWVLYETLTEDVQEPEQITNKRSIKEAKIGDIIDCSVEIMFEHLMTKYRLKRTKKVTKLNNEKVVSMGQTQVIMQFVGDNGRWLDIDDYTDEIGRILPKLLHNYFFFNGERIEWIQRPVNKKEFAQAITLLVGDETYIRGIRHLNSAKKKLDEELQNIGDSETKGLYKEKEQLEKRLELIFVRLEDHNKNLEGYRKEEKILSDRLLSFGGEVKNLEEKRKKLNEDLDSFNNSLKENRKILVDFLSDKGYYAFSTEAVEKFLLMISGLRQTGMIPKPYKSTFVKQLLERGLCICGRDLIEGEPPYQEVEIWLSKASISEYEEIALKMEGVIEQLGRDIPNIFTDLDRQQKLRHSLLTSRLKTESEISEISEKLRGSDVDKAREVENKLQSIRQQIEDTIFKQGEDTRDSNILISQIEQKEEEIFRREAKSAKEKIIKLQIKACKKAIEELITRQNKLRKGNQLDLQKRINKIFNEITYKPYKVKMSDDYSLALESLDGTVGKSTSESQILSLSFIFALMEQAKEYAAKQELIGVDSSVFPIVIDSAFGNLGEAYQKKVAENIPRLANQSLILVSTTQWNDNIENQISPYIGKEYLISYYTPKPDALEVTTTIGGVKYNLVKKCGGDEDYIEINEVNSRV